jgi:quinohemoprotein amine dehydrogenase
VTVSAAAPGLVSFAAGDAAASVALYTAPDRISVEPAFTIARVGGGDPAAPPPVPAAFSAVGWWNGPDGLPETEDDIRIGAVPAEWSVGDANETAVAMQDAMFAGEIGADGIFTPAIAGPNPDRKFSTNNAGELNVVATAGELSASGQLIVTVQRFIDPPIR